MGKKGISVGAAMTAGSKMVLDAGNYRELRDSYRDESIKESIKNEDEKKRLDKHRAIELGLSTRLFEKMCEAGADVDEYRRMMIYMYLTIDMFKYSVDLRKAANDLKIVEIKNKYK